MFPNVKEGGSLFFKKRGDICHLYSGFTWRYLSCLFLSVCSISRPHKGLLSLPLFSISNVLRNCLSDMFPIYVVASHLSNWQSLDSRNIAIVSLYQKSSSVGQDKWWGTCRRHCVSCSKLLLLCPGVAVQECVHVSLNVQKCVSSAQLFRSKCGMMLKS